MPPPPPGGPPPEHDQQQQQRKAGAVISGKSTVVPLPKAHEDKRGECGGSGVRALLNAARSLGAAVVSQLPTGTGKVYSAALKGWEPPVGCARHDREQAEGQPPLAQALPGSASEECRDRAFPCLPPRFCALTNRRV